MKCRGVVWVPGMMLLNPRGPHGSDGGAFFIFLLLIIADCSLKPETVGSETHPDSSPHHSLVAVWWGLVEAVTDGDRREDSSVHPLPLASPAMFKALTQFSRWQQIACWFGPCSRRMDI